MATIEDLCGMLNDYQEGLGHYVMERYGSEVVYPYDDVVDIIFDLFEWDEDILGFDFWDNAFDYVIRETY